MTPKQQARLAQLRNRIAYYNVNGRKCLSLPFGTVLFGKGDKGEIYCDSVEQFGELVCSSENGHGRNSITGYFADPWQSSTILFGVVRISTPKGRLYVPVTWNSDSDGVTYYMSDGELVLKTDKDTKDSYGHSDDVHNRTIKDVMYSADSCAERQAENEREFCIKDSAENRVEELKGEIEETMQSFKDLWQEKQQSQVLRLSIQSIKTVRQLVRARLREYVKELRSLKEQVDKLIDDPYIIVEGKY